jgi:superfamily II helicase
VASEALIDMSATPKGKTLLARLAGVVIAQGGRPRDWRGCWPDRSG